MAQMDFLAANHVRIVGLWATVYKLTVVTCVHMTAYYKLWTLWSELVWSVSHMSRQALFITASVAR